MFSRSAGPTEGLTSAAERRLGSSEGVTHADRAASDPASDERGRWCTMSRVERALTAGEMRIESQRRGSVHEIALAGELDLATAKAVQHELAAVEATDADQIVLDLAALDFIAATGLQLILSADARCGADGSRLKLLHGPPQVQRMFEITATSDRLPFCDR